MSSVTHSGCVCNLTKICIDKNHYCKRFYSHNADDATIKVVKRSLKIVSFIYFCRKIKEQVYTISFYNFHIRRRGSYHQNIIFTVTSDMVESTPPSEFFSIHFPKRRHMLFHPRSLPMHALKVHEFYVSIR